MVAQSTAAGDKKAVKEDMAATEHEKTTEKANAKDDALKEDQKIGQKATKDAGVETPVSEDDDDKKGAKNLGKALVEAGKDDAEKTSGKAVGKAEKDEAAKTLGKADGKAGQVAHDEVDDENAFVSPEDGPQDR